MKSTREIASAVEKTREIVREVYKDDERLKQAPRKGAGVVRETDMVFQEVLRYLLNN